MAKWRVVLWTSFAVASSACGIETVVNKIDEREANRILELLESDGVPVTKVMVDTGREQYFNIAVPPRSRLQAIKLLNQYEMPARKSRGYDTVFQQGGMIPTQAEEGAKKLSALEGEIEKQLRLVTGILDVEVQIVMPEANPLKTTETQPASASVTIKYLPNSNGAKPLSEPQVQAIVAAGVDKLTPDRVVVVMTASGLPSPSGRAEAGSPLDTKVIWKDKRVQIALASGIIVILLMGIGLAFNLIRLRTVRGRLIRLQTEIARAKKRPAEALPSQAAG